jgi:MFS transporter, FHS family, glucose/mannose:H+ symporter
MPENGHSAAIRRPFAQALEPLLHLGFALTGAGTVLLGSILPHLAQEWRLRDKDAGLLLLVQFAASASAALLVRRNLWKTLSIGYALLAAGGGGIFLLQSKSLPAFAVFGLGLGLAMTSTNMITGRLHPQRMGAALALLNFSWSAGSVVCPLLAAPFLRDWPGRDAFATMGALALPFTLLPLFATRKEESAPVEDHAPTGKGEVGIIVYFALLAFLYVGVEASVGNWLSTFAARNATLSFRGSTLTVAVFWAAIVLGRAATPVVLTWMRESSLYLTAVVTTLATVALLLWARTGASVLTASALIGLSLAPVFPLLLALFLRAIGRSRNAGWVFATAGLGGAVLSWLTGIVSSSFGSLRIGLLVPAAAAALMLILALRLPRQKA